MRRPSSRQQPRRSRSGTGVGQPVLVGTTDISKSERLSELLKRRGVPHEVLNAKQHEREATIVAEAGRPGAVTVATNMAGRGTDIVLGGNPEALGIDREQWEADHKKVVELGGLHITGTERHEARRIDNQLRGRAGRQGDPGSSRFYLALDDDLMKRFGGDRIKTVMGWAGLDEGAPIENRMVSKSIGSAQVKVEAYHFDIRKQLVEYDDVVNTHRGVIYGERDKVLSGADLKANIQSMVERELRETMDRYLDGVAPENWDLEGLLGASNAIFPLPKELSHPDRLAPMDATEIEDRVLARAKELYSEQEGAVTPEAMRAIERQVMLRIVDANWVQHLTAMENLRQGIGLYAYGQRDPLVMYKKESYDSFQNLMTRIQHDIVHTIYRLEIRGASGNGRRGPGRGKNEQSVMSRVMGARSRQGRGGREPQARSQRALLLWQRQEVQAVPRRLTPGLKGQRPKVSTSYERDCNEDTHRSDRPPDRRAPASAAGDQGRPRLADSDARGDSPLDRPTRDLSRAPVRLLHCGARPSTGCSWPSGCATPPIRRSPVRRRRPCSSRAGSPLRSTPPDSGTSSGPTSTERTSTTSTGSLSRTRCR